MEAVTLSICDPAKKLKVSVFVKEHRTFLAVLVNFNLLKPNDIYIYIYVVLQR